jgi:hypothetical protein
MKQCDGIGSAGHACQHPIAFVEHVQASDGLLYMLQDMEGMRLHG